ncbi:hypothetical protein Dimus_024550, partial [Dionaea muscipula]
EFYKNMTMRLSNKKDMATKRVRGVKIKLDCMTLASIKKIPENYGLSDYVKDDWEEARYCKPLEITRKFSNNETITKAGRVSSSLMKPFQRMVHIFIVKNLIPRFGKRNTTSFMDLTYMEYLTAKLSIHFPRLMPRHMAYVINVPHHELAYGELLTRVFDAFEVPLDDKDGDEPVKTDFFEETFLNISQLKRENGVWWLGSGANRRRYDEVNEKENEENEEEAKDTDEVENKGQNQQVDFDWEVVNEEVHVEGEQAKKQNKDDESGFGEKFYDAIDEEGPADEGVQTPTVPVIEVE